MMSQLPPTPPMVPGHLGTSERPTSWPAILGVIGIVLGSLGILGGGWGALAPFFINAMVEFIPDAGAAGLEGMQDWGNWITLMALVGGGVAAVLLISGIALVKRKRWGVSLTLIWAILKMLFVVGNSVLGYYVSMAQMEAMPPQTIPGLGGSFFTTVQSFSLMFSVLWGWALPVFFLIWFARARIRLEVAEWS